MSKLTEKQRRFADEYVRTGNITQSYLNAYHNVKNENTASANGSRLLGNAKVKAYIDNRLEELRKDSIAEQDEILQLLTSVARGDVQASTLIGEGGGKEKITHDMPPTMTERIKAAELLGKRYSLFTDRVDQTNRNIEINVGEWDED